MINEALVEECEAMIIEANHRPIGPYDFRDAENVDGIVESSHKKRNLQFNAECHGICQSLDELIKSRSVFPTGFCETCGGRWRHILICIFMTSLRQVCVQTSFGTSDFLLYELSHTVIQLNAQ